MLIIALRRPPGGLPTLLVGAPIAPGFCWACGTVALDLAIRFTNRKAARAFCRAHSIPSWITELIGIEPPKDTSVPVLGVTAASQAVVPWLPTAPAIVASDSPLVRYPGPACSPN